MASHIDPNYAFLVSGFTEFLPQKKDGIKQYQKNQQAKDQLPESKNGAIPVVLHYPPSAASIGLAKGPDAPPVPQSFQMLL